MPGPAQPPHIARTQRSSAQAQHTASPRKVITNEWTLYMAASIDPKTVDGLGCHLGWWRHTENVYKLVHVYRPNFLQSPMFTTFLSDIPWNFEHVLNVPPQSPSRMNVFYL